MEGYSIVYRKVWLHSHYIIFIPAFVVEGKENKEQHYFATNGNEIYYQFYNYERMENEFYHDFITEKELMELYDTADIESATSKYFDDIAENIVVGYLDTNQTTIELSNLPLYKLAGLTKNISYNINSDGMAEVRLTKSQLHSLSLEPDLDTLKRQIQYYYSQSEKLDNLYATKGITTVTFDALGNHLISFSKSNKQISKDEKRLESEKENINDIIESSTLTVYKYIVSRLVGQNDVVEDIVSAVVGNMKASNPHELITPFVIGPTGSGKSLLFKLLGECLDIPVIIVDCNTIVQSGYEGKNIEDVLKDLYKLCNEDIFKTEHAIVFLDEIDKIAANGASVSDIGAQNTLLKFIEGNKYVVQLDRLGSETITIDTSMMTIAAGGAFDNLTSSHDKSMGFGNDLNKSLNKNIEIDALKKYGMISELLARFNLFVQYNNVTEQMLYDSLTSSEISPLKIKQDYYLRAYNIKLTFNNSYIQRICQDAIKLKTGFRGITKAVNTSLRKLNFKLQCNPNQYHEVIVTDAIIDDPKQYVLY